MIVIIFINFYYLVSAGRVLYAKIKKSVNLNVSKGAKIRN